MNIQQKKLVVFDLDGTLAESKAPMDAEMGELIIKLLEKKMVAIISGGKYEMFQHQLPVLQPSQELIKKLFFFPTTGAHFYRYEDGWKDVYADEIDPVDRQKIKEAFEKVYKEINYQHPTKLYGEVVEDRKTQVTFSACGQSAPVEVKKEWQRTQDRRLEIAGALKKYLPNFEVRVAGLTSVDVTKQGIDKAYGVRQMEKHLGVPISEMVFVGDALFEGGNDHAALKSGIEAIQVSGPEDTKKLIRDWLKEL